MSSSHPSPALPPEPTRLRQIALVATNLDRATHLLTHVLGTEVIYRDPEVARWGLQNILVPLSGDILEIVSPIPSQPPNSTSASRLLSKRGDGSYMLIMQTTNAHARRAYIESRKLGSVIFEHESEQAICLQYHPRAVKGSVIPELDTQYATPDHPDPVHEPFSPWHALGPMARYGGYVAAMRRHADLRLRSVTCRLAEGDDDVKGAARWWEEVFGVSGKKTRGGEDGGVLEFTNAEVRFVAGGRGEKEEVVEIGLEVDGREQLDMIVSRARGEGLFVRVSGNKLNLGAEALVEMLGVRWTFMLRNRIEAKL